MKQIISTDKAPAAIGPYSQAVKAGSWLFASGQLGLVPETGEWAGSSVKKQTEQIFKNIAALLQEAGGTLDQVVKTTVFLADMATFGEMNEVYEKQFTPGNYPARSAVAVRELPKKALVEIEIVAFIP